MKPIKAVIRRKIIGTVSSFKITRTATGKYYAAILVDDVNKATVKDLVITKVIGLDMGLSDFVITSNGDKIPNPSFLTRVSDNLRRKQKALSCKQKESANWLRNRVNTEISEQDEKKRLARAIGDASWHRFIQKLIYKAEESGKDVVKVDQWYASSKTCHCCGH